MPDESTAAILPLRPMRPGRTLLILINSGRQSRNWLLGLGAAAKQLGIRHLFLELDQLWAGMRSSPQAVHQQLDEVFAKHKIGAMLSYGPNGLVEMPSVYEPGGYLRSFLELRGVPHLMLWADHPQWLQDKRGLQPAAQPALRSGNMHHFLKSEAHAEEIRRVLAWPNCYELPLSADAEALRPVENPSPDFDVVGVYANDLTPPDWMKPFLEQPEPDDRAIAAAVAAQVARQLDALWAADAPEAMRPQLQALGQRLISLKQANPAAATARHLPAVSDEFPQATAWLTQQFPTYFKLSAALWAFRNWQRIFLPAYLAKSFKVAIFGSTGDSPGVTKSDWVDFKEMPAALARGKVALNIVSGWDEEGLTAKTFEIAAAGVPTIHNDCRGLSDCFEPGVDFELFHTMRQAKDLVTALLDDPARRARLGAAFRAKLLSHNSWADRLVRMFALARLPIQAFR